MRTGRRPGPHDEGETLIELIIAVAIMGITVVAVVGGFATSILMSDIHRKEAVAGVYLRNYAAQLQGSYAPCSTGTPGTPDYPALLDLKAPSSAFATPTATVKFWVAPGFTSKCPKTDPGLQQVTLTLKTTDDRTSESRVVVVREP